MNVAAGQRSKSLHQEFNERRTVPFIFIQFASRTCGGGWLACWVLLCVLFVVNVQCNCAIASGIRRPYQVARRLAVLLVCSLSLKLILVLAAA